MSISNDLLIRLPGKLKQKIEFEAENQGVSINELAMYIFAKEIANIEASNQQSLTCKDYPRQIFTPEFAEAMAISAIQKSYSENQALLKKDVKTLYTIAGYTFKEDATQNGTLMINQKHCGIINKNLVECIDGTVDLKECGRLINIKNTDKSRGLIIVSSKGFDDNARSILEDNHISCLTYHELINEILPLDNYIREQIKTYEKKVLDQWEGKDFFVPPDIQAATTFKRYPVLPYFARWIRSDHVPLLILLGNVGSGKTTLLNFLTYQLARGFIEDPSRYPLPVFISLKTVNDELTLENIITRHFSQHGVNNIDLNRFFHLLNTKRLVLLFDEFDEMTDHTPWKIAQKKYQELCKASNKGGKVILTCRTHLFKNITEQNKLFDVGLSFSEFEEALTENQIDDKDNADDNLSDGDLSKIIYLREFDEKQISEFIQKAKPDTFNEDLEKIKQIYHLYELATSPLLLKIIVKQLEMIHDASDISSNELYGIFTQQWFDHIESDRWLLEKKVKNDLMLRLAWEMWNSNNNEMHYISFLSFLTPFTKPRKWSEKNLRLIIRELMAASFLKRNDDGHYSFIHPSIMEYFLAKRLYIAFKSNKAVKKLLNAKRFNRKIIYFLSSLDKESKCVIALLQNILKAPYHKNISENALQILYWFARYSCNMEEKVTDIEKLQKETALLIPSKTQLTQAALQEIDLEAADLQEADLEYANLTNANLLNALIQKANLKSARLDGAIMGEDGVVQQPQISEEDDDFADEILDDDIADDIELEDLDDDEDDDIDFSDDNGEEDIEMELVEDTEEEIELEDSEDDIEIADDIEIEDNIEIADDIEIEDDIEFDESEDDIEFDESEENIEQDEIQEEALETEETEIDGENSEDTTESVEEEDVPDIIMEEEAPEEEIAIDNKPDKEKLMPAIQSGHNYPICSISYHSKLHLLASSDSGGGILVIDVNTKRILFQLDGHQQTVNTVQFSPDGKYLVSASDDHTLRVWDIKNGGSIFNYERHQSAVISAAFSPDSQNIASGSEDQSIHLWNARYGNVKHVFNGHSGAVSSLDFSPDGRFIVSGSFDQSICLWDVQSGEAKKTFKGHQRYVSSVKFSPDNQNIASGSDDKTVRIWNLQKDEAIHVLHGHSQTVSAINFSPNGKILVSASYDKTLRLWNTHDALPVDILKGHHENVTDVTFISDNNRLISGSNDQNLRLWDIEKGGTVYIFDKNLNSISSISFSPDGKSLVNANNDKTFCLWNIQNGDPQVFEGHQDQVKSVQYSPDSHLIASGSDDQTARVWDTQKKEALHILYGHSDSVNSVDFSFNGNNLVTGSNDQTIRIWSVQTGETKNTMKGHSSAVISVKFSPNGQLVASASFDKTVRLWNIKNSKATHILKGHSKSVVCVDFSPDGKFLASGSYDKTIRLWKVQRGKLSQALKGHTHSVVCVAFSPDGKHLVSGSYDQTVRLWDLKTGQCQKIMKGHWGGVYSVRFSKNGKYIVAAGTGGRMQFWDPFLGKTFLYRYYFEPDAWIDLMPEGRFNGSKQAMKYLRYTEIETLKNYSSENLLDDFFKPDDVKSLLLMYNEGRVQNKFF